VIVAVHSFTIGVAASVSDPHAGTGAHDGFERGNKAAGRMLDFDSAAGRVLMNVWLTVCEDDNPLSVQVPIQSLFQAHRGPQPGSVFPFIGHAPDQLAHIAENRLKLPALLASSAQHAAQFQAPVRTRSFATKSGIPKAMIARMPKPL